RVRRAHLLRRGVRMAVTGARVTVSTTAVALNSAPTEGQVLIIRNNDGANAADLGGSGVTAGAGFSLVAGATITLPVSAGEQVFAIRSSGADVVLSVLRA